MKTRENQTLHICEHCGKYYIRKYFCEKHENLCKKNPANIPACYGCKFLSKETLTIDTEHNSYDVQSFFCSKKQEYLKPIISEKRGSTINYCIDNEVMPIECGEFINEWEGE